MSGWVGRWGPENSFGAIGESVGRLVTVHATGLKRKRRARIEGRTITKRRKLGRPSVFLGGMSKGLRRLFLRQYTLERRWLESRFS